MGRGVWKDRSRKRRRDSIMAIEGKVLEWDGTPWSCKMWAFDCKRVYGSGEHCEVPPGEPTGENIIPALPDRGFPNSMLSLKQMYCNAVKEGNQDLQRELLDKISRLREYWRQLRSKEREELLKKTYGTPGAFIRETIKPIIIAGGVVMGILTISAGAFLYLSSRTGTTEKLARGATEGLTRGATGALKLL